MIKSKKALQKFKKLDLEDGKKMDPNHIASFLDDFMKMAHGYDKKTKMISLRVPENILDAFRFKARQRKMKYQAQIVELMREWLNS